MTPDDHGFDAEQVVDPDRVAAVCKLWRRVALDSFRVWSQVYVPGLCAAPDNGARTMKVLELRLQRSRKLPLDIDVYWRGYTSLRPEHHSALRLLAEHSRWRRVRFVGPNLVRDLVSVLGLFTLQTPLLEQVYIEMPSLGAIPWSDNSPLYLPDRQRLRHFTTVVPDMIWAYPRDCRCLLAHLELWVQDIQSLTIWGVLAEIAPTLEYLDMSYVPHGQSLHAAPTQPVHFPVLHTIRGHGCSEDVLALWAGFVLAPRLATFSLHNGDVAVARSFLARTCANATTLELDDAVLERDTALAMRPLAHLRRLLLDCRHPDPEFLEAFAEPLEEPPASWLCPKLHTIVVLDAAEPSAMGLLARVIRRRCEAAAEAGQGAPSRIVTVEFDKYCRNVDEASRLLLSHEISASLAVVP